MIDRLLSRRDLVLYLGLGAVAVGFVSMGLGWLGAARKDTVPEQFPYLLSGGLIGLGLVFVGSALLVIRAFGMLREQSSQVPIGEAAERSLNGGKGSRRRETVVVGASSYHRASCRLVQDRDGVELVPIEVARQRELTPCRVCAPPT